MKCKQCNKQLLWHSENEKFYGLWVQENSFCCNKRYKSYFPTPIALFFALPVMFLLLVYHWKIGVVVLASLVVAIIGSMIIAVIKENKEKEIEFSK